MEHCSNCGQPSSSPFCPACGQPEYRRLSFGGLFRGSVLRLFDLEGGFLHTAVCLSTRPGNSIRQYVQGRRRPYTHPVSYCFVLVTLYALVVNLLDVEISIPGILEFSELEARVYHILHGILAYLVFVILLPVAWIQTRLFRSAGLNVAETYAFALFASGHVNLASALFVAAGWLGSLAGIVALLILQFAYLVWAMTGFYRLSRPPVVRGLVVGAANFLISNVLSLVVGNLIVVTGLLEQAENFIA